jgi:hypothetical protein
VLETLRYLDEIASIDCGEPAPRMMKNGQRIGRSLARGNLTLAVDVEGLFEFAD